MNLEILETRGINGYIPESSEKNIGKIAGPRAELFQKEDFQYDEDKDIYICPAGQQMDHVTRRTTKSKYSEKHITTYRTERGICKNCQLQQKCTTNETLGRAITRDGYEEYRQRMRKKINTEEGKKIYGKRKILAEPVFGRIG